MNGFRPRIKTETIVCDWGGLAPAEGAEPLFAVLQSNLTLGEIEQIPNPLQKREGQIEPVLVNTDALRKAVAPYIIGWNVEGRDSKTGEFKPLPPPAEAGPDILRFCDTLIAPWIALELRTMHMGGKDLPKDSTPSGTTEPSSPDSTPAAEARPKRRPSRPKASASTSGST